MRIQQALDHCGPGKSVRLSAGTGAKRAFLSGPIELRSGVTLVVEKDVALLASREARDFQTTPGSCGLVDEKGHGCRALISCANSADAGLMGEGTVNERAGAAILGETYSWRDLVGEARLTGGKVNAPGLLVLQGCDRFALFRIALRDPVGPAIVFRSGDGLIAWDVKASAANASSEPGLIETTKARNIRIIKSNLRETVAKSQQ